LQYAAAVRSHTDLSVRNLEGEVAGTRLKGDTADILHLAELG
jgi:hypothetical protein